MLSPGTIQRLHDLGCKYQEWLKILIEKQRQTNKTYGEQFYFNAEIQEYVHFGIFKPSAFNIFFFFRNNSKSLRLDNGVSQGDNSAMGGAESDMDLSTSKASEPQEGSNSKLMCENIYCLDHLKVFKFASHKERHDR